MKNPTSIEARDAWPDGNEYTSGPKKKITMTHLVHWNWLHLLIDF